MLTSQRVVTTIGVATVGLLALTASPLAAPHAPGPPNVRISIGARTERVEPWSYTWTNSAGGGCASIAADGIPGYGDEPIRVRAGHRVARIVFRTSERPKSVDLRQWSALDAQGQPVGNSSRLPARIRRVGGPGPVRWMARAPLNVSRERYVDVFVHWHYDECGGGTDDASWNFHVAPR
jgi:hypothetical protein